MSTSLSNIFDSSDSDKETNSPATHNGEEKTDKDEKAEVIDGFENGIHSEIEEGNRESLVSEQLESEDNSSEEVEKSEESSSFHEEESEGLEEEIEVKKPVQRRGRKKRKDQSDEPLTEESATSQKVLEARKDFEEALARSRVSSSGSRRRRNYANGEDGIPYSDSVEFDDFAIALRNKMDVALKRDIQHMINGKTALERHRLLPQVIAALNKRGLQDILLENGILSSIREWLEPIKTDSFCSLPAINLRKPLLETLKTIPIDTSSLPESGIGRIVYFFSKRDDESSEVKRLSTDLVIKWSQPIIASFDSSFPSSDKDKAGTSEKYLESEKYKKLMQSDQHLNVAPSQSQSVYQKLVTKRKRK